MSARADFSAATRKLLAQRAGYQCSVLNCGRSTAGPGPGPADVVDIGMAAHIFAASEGGPRGTGGLPASERGSAGNGIWCCYNHGKAIDSSGGNVFPAAELKAWKRLHEARKGAEVLGTTSDRFGLVESITVNSAPAALAGRKFDLGMRNIVTGPNESGKSMLAKLIASVAHPHHVAELSRTRDVDIAVRWFDPHTHEVSTTGRSGQVRHVLDGLVVPYVARPFKTILLVGRPSNRPTLTSLAQQYDLSTAAMRATIELLPQTSAIVREVRFHGDEVVFVAEEEGRTIQSTSPNWSGRTFGQVMLELAGAHAQHHARVEPTFLLIDEFMDFLDPRTQIAALERLEAAAGQVQMAIISHSTQLVAACRQTWSITDLEGRRTFDPRSPIDIEIDST